MTGMIERVARAIHASRLARLTRVGYDEGLAFDQLPGGVREIIRADARAAIEAMREPTEAMLERACRAYDDATGREFADRDGMRAALQAALDEEG